MPSAPLAATTIPVSADPSAEVTAGSTATTTRTKSGPRSFPSASRLRFGWRRSLNIARFQSAPGVSDNISAYISCRPRLVPAYWLTILAKKSSARLARFS